jgi:hypothetical protein
MRMWAGMGVALALLGGPYGRAAVVVFDLAAAADKDVVYEGGAGTQRFGENPFGTQAFAVEGYTDGSVAADGLPVSRQLASTQADLGNYELLAYDGPNIVELYAHQDGPIESHVVGVPNLMYTKIGLLVSAVEGDASFTIRLNYQDGTTTAWWEADDWYEEGGALRASQLVVIGGMDRVNVQTGQVEDSNHFSLFEFLVAPDPTRVLTSITVGNDPNRWPGDQHRWAGLFAMNGQSVDVVPEPGTVVFFGLGAGLLWWRRRAARRWA